MPITQDIIRMRQRRRSKINRAPQRGGFGFAIISSITVFIILFGLVGLYSVSTSNLPSIETLPLLLEPPDGLLLNPTMFYDNSGKHIIHTVENPAVEERRYYFINNEDGGKLEKGTFPSSLIQSTIAISDPTFDTNPGYTLRVTSRNSPNTLAQRLVSDLLLWDEAPGVLKSIRERILAAQITHEFGREKIIEWYLNSSDYGNLAYGADAAAQVYFGKPVTDINLMESAILAAVSESPELNPFDSPQTAHSRGNIVIDAMVGQGLITKEIGIEAKSLEIVFKEPLPSMNTLAPSFIKLAWDYLSLSVPFERLDRGGFEIITSLDYDLQNQVKCTAKIHLFRINGEDNNTNLVGNDDCSAANLLPTISLTQDLQYLKNLSANIVVMDPRTGQILAMVGDSSNEEVGRGIQKHPPGTLLTPIVYLTAFTRGYSPASLVWDIPLELPDLSMDMINKGGHYEGPIRLRHALANDYLLPAIRLFSQLGYDNIEKIAHQLGITTISGNTTGGILSGCHGCEMILEGGDVSIVEVVQAYSVFANQGVLVGFPGESDPSQNFQPLHPVSILSVNDTANRSWLTDPESEARPVISNQLAYLMTNILSDEGARWPSMSHPNPLEIGRPTGAKIGTTLKGNDVWTVGFTPQFVVGVWMGTPESEGGREIQPKISSALWHAIIQHAVQGFAPDGWRQPPGITAMDVCDPSGMLPTLQCPNIVSEIFLTGQEPTQPDMLYRTIQVNRETERLATIFTPPELIEERVYMNIPPEAMTWADSVNLEKPPEIYDQIYTPSMDPDIRIDSPIMLDQVNGIVKITGQASGPEFRSYRLQAGEGINPSGWRVIQEESMNPVVDGTLGIWDTSELNGLFAIQLIVLQENQSVETATIQVTIDNRPPDLTIQYPADGQMISQDENETVTFIIQADDNVGLEKLEYYIDDSLVGIQSQSPYALSWRIMVGTHQFSVKAIDTAGNISQVSITISVEK